MMLCTKPKHSMSFAVDQDLVGTKVQVLFNVSDKKQAWYTGHVTKVDDDQDAMCITFDDGDEQTYTTKEAAEAVQNKEMRFIELIDLSDD